jgi:hypothetical protein
MLEIGPNLKELLLGIGVIIFAIIVMYGFYKFFDGMGQ